MNSDTYVVIQGWMCNELNLKGNELLVFALINGFSQDGESVFRGSRDYIASTFNISLPTVDKCLKGLLDKQLIEKVITTHNGVVFNQYKTLPGVKKLYQGGKKTLPNNIDNKIDNNLSKDKLTKSDTEGTNSFSLGKKKKENKPGLFSQCVNLINEYTQDEQLNKALMDYLKVRLDNTDKPLYSARMWKALLDKLDREFKPSERLQVVYQSIERGYASFFPTDSNYFGSNSKTAKCGEIQPYGHTLEGIPHDGRYDNEDHTRSGLIF